MRLPPVEVGALLLLLVALAITASFFFDPARNSFGEPSRVSLGLPPEGALATPTRLDPPARWFVTYFVDGAAEPSPSHQGIVDGLDLAYAAAPFGDLPDDAWHLVAEITLALPAGRYAFAVERDGAFAAAVDDRPIGAFADPAATVRTEVTFAHSGGDLVLRLEARDEGGPFVLRWLDE